MNKPALATLQLAALIAACVQGLGEFAALQAWRLRDRLGRRA